MSAQAELSGGDRRDRVVNAVLHHDTARLRMLEAYQAGHVAEADAAIEAAVAHLKEALDQLVMAHSTDP